MARLIDIWRAARRGMVPVTDRRGRVVAWVDPVVLARLREAIVAERRKKA